MANGFRKRLDEAKASSEKIKVLFQYPGHDKVIKKSGFVIDVDDYSFTLDETYDGESTYSYQFIVEVTKETKGLIE